MSVKSQIVELIKQKSKGTYVFASDFSNLADNTTIRQTLRRIEKEGLIAKEARGIWIYQPQKDESSKITEAVSAIAKQNGLKVVPFPSELISKLGKAINEDENIIFYTTASTRKYNIGEKTVTIKHSSDSRLFNFKTSEYRDVYIAMKVIGTDNLLNEDISLINDYLKDIDTTSSNQDINLLTAHMRAKIMSKSHLFIDAYIPEIISLCKEYNVKELFLFGSVLTDNFNEHSDIDFAVTFLKERIKDYADNYFDFKYALADLLKRELDLVEIEAVRNTIFKLELEKTKQLVYVS